MADPTEAVDVESLNAGWLLKAVRDIAFTAAIYLFFCGYVFRSEYYRAFGLPTSASINDSVTMFVYSYDVFSDQWRLVAIAVFLASALLMLMYRFARRTFTPAMLGVAILAFPFLAHIASSAARSEAASYAKSNPFVNQLTLGIRKTAVSGFSDAAGKQLLKESTYGRMRLFAISDGKAFVSIQELDPEGQPADLKIYAVPFDEISHLDIDLPEGI